MAGNMLDPLMRQTILDHGTALPIRSALDVSGDLVVVDDPVLKVTRLSVTAGGGGGTVYDGTKRAAFWCEGAPNGEALFSMLAGGSRSARVRIDWASTSETDLAFGRGGTVEATVTFAGSALQIDPVPWASLAVPPRCLCFDGDSYIFAGAGDISTGSIVGFQVGPPDMIQRSPLGASFEGASIPIARPSVIVRCGLVGYVETMAALDYQGSLFVFFSEEGQPQSTGALHGLRLKDLASPGDGTLYGIADGVAPDYHPVFYKIDISDPHAPAVDGTPLQLSGDAVTVSHVAIEDSEATAYVSGYKSGGGGRLYVVDVASAPSVTATIDHADLLPDGMLAVVGTFVYQAKRASGTVRSVDCTTPGSPVIVTLASGGLDTVAIFADWPGSSDRVYTVDNYGWIGIVDISTPATPTIKNSYVAGPWPVAAVPFDYGYPGKFIVCALRDGRFQTIDVTDPDAVAVVPAYPLGEWIAEPNSDGQVWFMASGGEAACCGCCGCCPPRPRYYDLAASWIFDAWGG